MKTLPRSPRARRKSTIFSLLSILSMAPRGSWTRCSRVFRPASTLGVISSKTTCRRSGSALHMNRLGFQIEKTLSGSRARAGRFRTLHNEVLTPLFMPVGTNATVRAQRFETLEGTGSQILLANTFHLLLRPGPEVFRRFDGIHRFMGWNRSVLTDSGGYQMFSLTRGCRLSEEGAVFRSYVDGRSVALSPEASIGMQRAIGSDIMMVLDQCIPALSN